MAHDVDPNSGAAPQPGGIAVTDYLREQDGDLVDLGIEGRPKRGRARKAAAAPEAVPEAAAPEHVDRLGDTNPA